MTTAGQPASGVVTVAELGQLVRSRRTADGLTLRQLQAEMENRLSASALSRIENGAVPDPKNVPTIADWLGIPVNQIAWPGQSTDASEGRSTPDVVAVHLRADKNLDARTADVLARTFRRLYEDIVEDRIALTEGTQTE